MIHFLTFVEGRPYGFFIAFNRIPYLIYVVYAEYVSVWKDIYLLKMNPAATKAQVSTFILETRLGCFNICNFFDSVF